MASSAVHQSSEVANGSAGMKNNKSIDINEEKDGSSAGSMDETNATQYLNNANHVSEDSQALVNGSSQSHHDSTIGELQEKLQRRDNKIKHLETRNDTILHLKQKIEQNFKDKVKEAEDQIMELGNEIDNERSAKLSFQELSESSQRNLQSFEHHNITVESHLAMHDRVKELQGKCENLVKFDKFQMENDEKYLSDPYQSTDDNKLLVILQQTVADRDNLVCKLKSFQTQMFGSLNDIRNEVALVMSSSQDSTNNDASDSLKDLETRYNKLESESKETMDTLNKEILQLNRVIKSIQREKTTAEKETKSKDSQLQKLRQRLNEQETQMSRHKKQLNKQKNDFDHTMERSNEEKTSLVQKYEKLENSLKTEREGWQQERDSRINFKEENQRMINQEKKKVSQSLDKEQEFRINLEHKLRQSEDSLKKKKSLISKLNTNMKTCQMQLETEEKKYQDSTNEQKLLKKKYDDASNNEKTAHSQMVVFEEELVDIQERLNRMKEQNSSLHEAMRKKDGKLKLWQEKESNISKLENDAISMEKKAKKKLEKAKKIEDKMREKLDHGGRNAPRINRNSFLARNDPFHVYRNVVPFHWVAAVLGFFLFIMFCKANL